MCSPPLAGGEHRSSPTSTLPSVPALLLQERLRHPSSHARTPEHGRLAQLWLRSTAVERRGRSLPHRPRTRRRRVFDRLVEQAACRGLLDLILHRFHRREDDARRPRRVEGYDQPPKSTTTATAVRSSRPGKRSRLPRSSPSKQAPEETAMRVTCDALAVETDLDAWRQRLRHARLARPPAGRRGRASRSVQRTKHRRSERHRVQGRSPHRRTQRGRSAEAIDARQDVQPPEWSRTNQRRRQDCGLGHVRARAASTHEHKCSSRCAFVSLLRSPTTNAEQWGEY